MTGEIYVQLILILVLIAVNGLFALSEMALVTVRPTQIVSMSEQGAPGAERLKRLTKDSSRFLSTIQVTITLSGFLASASATATLAGPFSEVLTRLGIPAAWAGSVAILLVTGVVSYISLVFGELVPKQMALRSPAKLALRVAPLVEGLGTILYPFVRILSTSTQLILKALGIKPGEGRSSLSEDELRRLVAQHRTLEEDEKELIESVFEFGDESIAQVMVPRADTVAIPSTQTVLEAVGVVTETGYSRFPVYRDDLDDICGIVTAKDLLAAIQRGETETPIEGLCREAYVIPEAKNALALLQEMRHRRIHMAIVVDEYGTNAGIVTMEDLVEEIVGDIQDETDPEPEQWIISDGENGYVVDAGAQMEEVVQHLGRAVKPDGFRGTLAAFLLARFQRIPKVGESIDHTGLRFTVDKVDRYRIERVRIVALEALGEPPHQSP